jgi:hypothetical protein
MHIRGGAVALLTAVLCWSFAISPGAIAGSLVGPDWATKWVLYNASNADVTCMVVAQNLGGVNQQDGCPIGSLSAIKIIDLTGKSAPQSLVPFGTPVKCWFKLKRGQKVQLVNLGLSPKTKQPTYCLPGLTVGFGQIPYSCADTSTQPSGRTAFPDTKPGKNYNQLIYPALPNGSTGVEATLNMPGTFNGQAQPGLTTNEAVDITCLAGANCTLVGQLIPPAAGPYWTTDMGPKGGGAKRFKSPVSFQNSWVDVRTAGCDDNCVDPKTGLARPGVYPYGCSQCNEFPDKAPQCTGKPYPDQFCAAKNGLPWNNGCNFTRSPLVNGVQKFGGTFLVTYKGPLSPPKKGCK